MIIGAHKCEVGVVYVGIKSHFVLSGHLFNLIIVRLLNPIDIWSVWYFHD